MKTASPAAQLAGFMARFTPEIAARGRAVVTRVRKLLPPSVEMVYDNYNFLVVGFSPTDRPSDAAFSVAMFARGVSLCFLHGARLPDPHGLLVGGGKQVRHIKLPTVEVLDEPRVRALIATAVKLAAVPYANPRRCLVIKSISPTQRPRRPAPPNRRRG
jgi:hypothetical protein